MASNEITPFDLDAARILRVSQPSAADIAAEIDCDKILSFHNSNFVNTEAAMVTDKESVPRPEKREYHLVVGMIKHREAMKSSLGDLYHNSHLGTVFAGSGLLRSKRIQVGN